MMVLMIVLAVFIMFFVMLYAFASMFYPDEYISSTYAIDFEKLYADGYRGVIFDIDNTLVMHNEGATDRAKTLLAELSQIGFGVLFLSNNKEPRVKSFRDEALPQAKYIYKAGKPLKKGYILATKELGTKPDNTVFIGDQLFTDVWGAKRCNMYNILVHPINPKEEIQIILKRKLEWVVLKRFLGNSKSYENPHEKSKNS